MKAIIATTNGILLEGTTDFIGDYTMCIDAPTLPASKATKLYEIGATMRQRADDWEIQIAKKHIEGLKLFDEE